MRVAVQDGNMDKALKVLKRKMQREGILREMKQRAHYMKPSEVKAKARAAAVKRSRKADRQRAERDR
jgi:small subunit ribosomal protein S21